MQAAGLPKASSALGRSGMGAGKTWEYEMRGNATEPTSSYTPHCSPSISCRSSRPVIRASGRHSLCSVLWNQL